jgi:recombination protein RecR
MSGFESSKLNQLILALKTLPGVGPKSAQRIAFHLIQNDKPSTVKLSEALKDAADHIGSCRQCRMLTENELCSFCTDQSRDFTKICIVESPIDILAMESSGVYRGQYFVLMGRLSPIDGIGPNQLGFESLETLMLGKELDEVIIATGMTVEGDATAHLLSLLAHKHNLKASRLAFGLPAGGELEYADSNTLSRALTGRNQIPVDL